MLRVCVLVLALAAGLAAFAAAATTVVVNGKTVTVPTVEVNGKVYVDAVALMKILGGTATYDPKTHKLVITDPTVGGGSPGTAQLAGDNGEFNKIYSLSKSDPLYFTLLRAEYTTTPLACGNRLFIPRADEKLLVLHFTVQNPQKTERTVRHDSLHMTVVDAMDVNHEMVNCWGDETSRVDVNLRLKPAQKQAVYCAFLVPAKGVTPKLMVMPNTDNDGPILRYDLRDKVTPLPAPIADVADPAGATALELVPGAPASMYAFGNFDVAVEKFSYVATPLNNMAPDKGGRFLVVNLAVKNRAPFDINLRHDTFKVDVTDLDGGLLKFRAMFFASSDRPVAQMVPSGQEMKVRLVVAVPQGSTPAKLTLREGQARGVVFEVKE